LKKVMSFTPNLSERRSGRSCEVLRGASLPCDPDGGFVSAHQAIGSYRMTCDQFDPMPTHVNMVKKW
jgi:hypothetical protein